MESNLQKLDLFLNRSDEDFKTLYDRINKLRNEQKNSNEQKQN